MADYLYVLETNSVPGIETVIANACMAHPAEIQQFKFYNTWGGSPPVGAYPYGWLLTMAAGDKDSTRLALVDVKNQIKAAHPTSTVILIRFPIEIIGVF